MNRYAFNNKNYSWYVKGLVEVSPSEYELSLNICEYGNDPVCDDESVLRHAYLDAWEIKEALNEGLGQLLDMEALFQKDNTRD